VNHAYRGLRNCKKALVHHGLARLVDGIAAVDGRVPVRLKIDEQHLGPLAHPQHRAQPYHAQQHDDCA
jgi:hypothetical protein